MGWFPCCLLCVIIALTGAAQAAATPSKLAHAASSPTPRGRLAALAPADMYFGPFGMSPLSIRSTIGLLGRQYQQRTIGDADLLRKAAITEDALRRWREKFPGDPWLAPTFLHLAQLYAIVQTSDARSHATMLLSDVVRMYPDTKQGHLSRLRLAAGFPALGPGSPLAATPAPATTAAPPAAVNDGSQPSPSVSPAAPTAPPAVQPSSPPAQPAPLR